MYIVEDTVERSIYDISVTRRLTHISEKEDASLEKTIDAANTMELEERPIGNLLAKGSSGGELVGKEDLWSCLFRQRPGHDRYSQEAEREIARYVGGNAAEARRDSDEQSWNEHMSQ